MDTVKLSPQFNVVIPRKVRQSLESLGVRPGQKFQLLVYRDRIELIPFKRMKQVRGFLKGIDTTVERDPDRV